MNSHAQNYFWLPVWEPPEHPSLAQLMDDLGMTKPDRKVTMKPPNCTHENAEPTHILSKVDDMEVYWCRDCMRLVLKRPDGTFTYIENRKINLPEPPKGFLKEILGRWVANRGG